MRTTFLPTLLGAGCALIASAALTVVAHADSVVTINPDGSVAQVESAQGATQQTFGTGADSYENYGGNSVRRGNNRGNTRFDGYNGYNGSGYAGGVNTVSPNAYGNARKASGARQGVQAQGRSTLRNAAPLHRGGGNGRDERDIIIDGDDNTVIIWPGSGYGYYPPYWGGYPIHVYPSGPVYGYPVYGYPGYGYPRYNYPRYTDHYGPLPFSRASNFDVYPFGGYPYFGYYGPGTYSHSYNGTVNGGFGGFSVGRGGLNVNLGGGRQRVTSRTETTVMPNTTVSTTERSTFGLPSTSGSLSPFVMPNRGSRPSNQPRANFGSRGSRGTF